MWTTLPWPEDSPFDATALEQRYRAARQMTGVMASGRLGLQAPQSLTYFWSLRTDGYEAWRNTPLDAWKDEAEKLWPATRQLLNQIKDHDQLTFARYRHRTHPAPVGGDRLVHIGDAWHAASPQLGQGANMALLDAHALASAMESAVDLAAALRQYVIEDLLKQKAKRDGKSAKGYEDSFVREGVTGRFRTFSAEPSTSPGKAAGLRIWYGPYDVGAYVEGPFESFVPHQVFSPFLTGDYKDVFAGKSARK